MKTFLYPLILLFKGVFALDINSLPACERQCLEALLREGPNYGCPATDNGGPAPECLCSKTEFAYGVRDCSTESCPSGTDISQVNNYGLQYCQSAQPSASGTALAALGIFSSGASAAPSSGEGQSSSREPISTIPVISTITKDSSTEETTIGSSTIYAGESISPTGSARATGHSNETAVTTRPVVSTVSESSTTRETTVGSTTEFSSASSSSSSAGAGPTMVAPRMVPGFVVQAAQLGFLGWVLPVLIWTSTAIAAAQLGWGGLW